MNTVNREKQQHREAVTSIVNNLADEYEAWFNLPSSGLGRYVALGEYILEETESDHPHDEWLMVARESFLKWKKDHSIKTSPPSNLKRE